MNEATQDSYKKLAAHFYATRLGGQPLTPKRIADALKSCADEYRPAYWRRLRNALAFDQKSKGYRDSALNISLTKNPATKPGSAADIKPKQTRVRRVAEADEQKLFQHFTKTDDAQVTAAIYIAMHTGARPTEMRGIRVEGRKVFIPAAKENDDGNRGAERIVELPAHVTYAIGRAVEHLQVDMGPVQDRIRAAGKKLWPQRKAVPTLYSWRHQMGSDLKASGLDRREVAYIMGHQSTASVDRYGNAKTARGGKVLPKPDADADLSKVREKHSEPPQPQAAERKNDLSKEKGENAKKPLNAREIARKGSKHQRDMSGPQL